MAIVDRCPLDKRVVCEALPAERLVGRKDGIGATKVYVPFGNPAEMRDSGRGGGFFRGWV